MIRRADGLAMAARLHEAENVIVDLATDTTNTGDWFLPDSLGMISGTGVYTGFTAGSTTVNYNTFSVCGLYTSSLPVTIQAMPDASFSIPSTIHLGETVFLSANAVGAYDGIWSSSDGSIASVFSYDSLFTYHKVIGVANGFATISHSLTNSCGTNTVEHSLMVFTDSTGGGGDSSIAPITGTTTVCVSANTALSDATPGGTWSSSNTSVAAIDGSGVVTGIATGTATISYTVFGSSVYTTVTVNDVQQIGNMFIGANPICQGAISQMFVHGFLQVASPSSIAGDLNHTIANDAPWVSGGWGSTAIALNGVEVKKAPAPDTVGCTGDSLLSYAGKIALIFRGSCEFGLKALQAQNAGALACIIVNNVPGGGAVGMGIGSVGGSVTIPVYNISYEDGVAIADRLNSGETVTMNTVPVNASGTWSSSDNSILGVDAGGLATGVSAGTASGIYTVSNSCGSNSRSGGVTVNGLPGVSEITGTSTICVGASAAMSNSTEGGTWSSSNSSVASVDGSGNVSGISVGTAVISYTVTNSCGSTSATISVSIINSTPSALNVADISGVPNICVDGFAHQLVRRGLLQIAAPSGIAGNINYAIGNPDASIVSGWGGLESAFTGVEVMKATPDTLGCVGDSLLNYGGKIALVFRGSCEFGVKALTAQNAGASACIIVNNVPGAGPVSMAAGSVGASVTIPVYNISYEDGVAISNILNSAGTVTMNDIPAPAGGTWSSSNDLIAVVDGSGVVAAVATGTANISYTVTNACGSASGTITVTVNALPSVASISGTSTICVGASAAMSDATEGGTWSSSNSLVAAVDAGGNVTGIMAGTAIISYTVTNTCGSTSVAMSVNISDPSLLLINTIAGSGTPGFSGDDGSATLADFNFPYSVCRDHAGNTYVADFVNNRVRKIDAAGVVTTICGDGSAGFSGDAGAASAATLNGPTSVCVDHSGNLYIADYLNVRVRKINTAGIISTVAGNGSLGYSGDGGSALSATFNRPAFITIDASDNLLITDDSNHCVRKVDALGNISTIAGSGVLGFSGDSGPAIAATLNNPGCVATDAAGNIFIADFDNNRIRKVDPSGTITTICGNGTAGYGGDGGPAAAAILNGPFGMAEHMGDIYISEVYGNRVRKIGTDGNISTVAGTGVATYGGDGGYAVLAALNSPTSVFVNNGGGIYIADAGNNRIRLITSQAGIISGSDTTCQGASVSFTSTVGGGSWSSSDGSIAIVGEDGQVTGVSGGNCVITYTVSGSCGNSITIKTINVSPLPATPAAITGDASVCAGANISLSDATAGGMWSSGNTSIATVSTDGVVSGVSAGFVNITYTVTNGCGSSFVISTITVNGAPSPGAITSGSSVCAGSTAALTATVPGGSWSSSNSAIATISASGVVSGVSAGAAVISYAVTNGCGTSAATFTINVIPATPAITGPSSVCSGTTINLANAVPGGTWSSNNTAIATVNSTSGQVTGVSVGNVVISYSAGCGTPAAVLVSVIPPPAGISGSATVCEGTIATLATTTTGGSWSSDNSTIASVSATGVVSGVLAGSTVITYSVSSCYTTKAVTVVAAPGAITGGTPSICAGAALALSNAVAGGVWTSSDPSVSTINSVSGLVTGVHAGTALIRYSIGSCQVSANLTVNATPSAITGSSTMCEGTTTILGNTLAGGVWSSSNTGVATISATGTVSGITSGVTTISYISNSCYATKDVSVIAAPAAITGGTSSICAGSALALSNAVSGGVWTSSDPSVSTINSVSGLVTGVHAGTALIRYSIGSCQVSMNLTVNATPSSISGTATVCESTTTLLGNTVSGGTWSSNNTGVATISASGTVSGVSAGISTISYISNGCYAVKDVTVVATPAAIAGATPVMCSGTTVSLTDAIAGGIWSSSNSSVSTINTTTGVMTSLTAGTALIRYSIGSCITTINLTVNTSPAAISGSSTLCQGTVITLGNTVAGGAWSSTNTGVATIAAAGAVSGVSAGTTTISYIVNGCSATKNVTVTPIPTAITGVTTPFCSGTTITLNDAVTGGVWNTSNASIATINSGSGSIRAVQGGVVNISYSIGGCVVSTLVTVTASPAAIGGAVSMCTGALITLTNTTSGGTWSSATPAVGTISASGVVSGVSSGTTTISYSNAGCFSLKTLTVYATPSAITGIPVPLCSGTILTLSNAVPGGVWNTSNASIATVNAATGWTRAVQGGSVFISYAIGSCIASATVAVSATPSVINGFSSLCNGALITLTDVTPSGTWSSSNTSVASVSGSGVVTGVVAGSATISYTVGGCSAMKLITVNPCLGKSADPGDDGQVIGNNNANIDVSIFPNPATNRINVKASVSVNAAVYSPDGKLLITQNDAHEIDVNNLSAGLYIIMVYDVNNVLIKTERLIKME